MKWIKRGLWVAAWGVWVWCGFGLYRELPRAFPLACDLSLPPNSTLCGFIADTHEIVFHERGASPQDRSHLHTVDAANAKLLRSIQFSGEAALLKSTFDTLRQGIILENVHFRSAVRMRRGLYGLAINNNERRQITD